MIATASRRARKTMQPGNDLVLTVAQMHAAEQAVFDSGVSVDALMERAGRGAAEYVLRVAAGRAVTPAPMFSGKRSGPVSIQVIARSGRRVAPMPSATIATRVCRLVEA